MKNNSRFTKIAVATGLVVCSGAAVLGLTGFASAQQAQNKAAAVVVAEADSNSGTNAGAATTTDGAATGSVGAQAIDGAPVAPFADEANRPNPVATAAKALGMTEAELTTELKAGKSISDVAKAKNVDLADVKAALVAEMKAHFAEEVKSGEHTQAEVDAKLAGLSAKIDTLLTTAGLPQGRGGHGGMGGKGGHGPSAADKAALAKVLKLTEAELQTQSQTKSLADIAKAQNVDIADVKAVILSGFKAHLAEEVTSGEHTQAEADQKLTEFTANLDNMVNNVRPAGGKGGRGGHGHGPHGDAPMGVPGATTNGTTGAAPQGAAFSA
jgi:hypothetical protein